jgi:hypothetical protein
MEKASLQDRRGQEISEWGKGMVRGETTQDGERERGAGERTSEHPSLKSNTTDCVHVPERPGAGFRDRLHGVGHCGARAAEYMLDSIGESV